MIFRNVAEISGALEKQKVDCINLTTSEYVSIREQVSQDSIVAGGDFRFDHRGISVDRASPKRYRKPQGTAGAHTRNAPVLFRLLGTRMARYAFGKREHRSRRRFFQARLSGAKRRQGRSARVFFVGWTLAWRPATDRLEEHPVDCLDSALELLAQYRKLSGEFERRRGRKYSRRFRWSF